MYSANLAVVGGSDFEQGETTGSIFSEKSIVERKLVSVLLQQPSLFPRAKSNGLSRSDFLGKNQYYVYAAMEALFEKVGEFDIAIVIDKLKKTPSKIPDKFCIDLIDGGEAEIIEMAVSAERPSDRMLNFYIQIVKEDSIARQFEKKKNELSKAIIKGRSEGKSLSCVLSECVSELQSLQAAAAGMGGTDSSQYLVNLCNIIDENFNARFDKTKSHLISTGISSIAWSRKDRNVDCDDRAQLLKRYSCYF